MCCNIGKSVKNPAGIFQYLDVTAYLHAFIQHACFNATVCLALCARILDHEKSIIFGFVVVLYCVVRKEEFKIIFCLLGLQSKIIQG